MIAKAGRIAAFFLAVVTGRTYRSAVGLELPPTRLSKLAGRIPEGLLAAGPIAPKT